MGYKGDKKINITISITCTPLLLSQGPGAIFRKKGTHHNFLFEFFLTCNFFDLICAFLLHIVVFLLEFFAKQARVFFIYGINTYVEVLSLCNLFCFCWV